MDPIRGRAAGASRLLRGGHPVSRRLGAREPGIAGLPQWDPLPFALLATIASAEAPLLALLILMRQQGDARIAELREETALQISLHSERQTTALIRLALEIQHELGVETAVDRDKLDQMTEELDPEQILHDAELEVGQDQDGNQTSP